MDISKFQLGGEWLKMEVEGKEKPLSLSLKIKPLTDSDQLRMADLAKKDKSGKTTLNEVKSLVLDWDLTEGKDHLECNEENRKKHLSYLLKMNLNGETERVEAIREKLKKDIERIRLDEKNNSETVKVLVEGLEKEYEERDDIDEVSVNRHILKFAQNFNNFIKN